MSTHDPSRSNQPARRLVLRKIAQPEGTVATPLPAPPPPEAMVLPRAVRTVSRSTPPPPAPTQSVYSSVAPVVATVITPLSTVLDSPRPARGASWKGVIGGTVLGLAVVAAFVVGTRLAQAPPSHAAAAAPAAPPPATTPLPAITPVATVAPAPGSPPVIAATALPLVPPPARWNPPVAAPRATAAAPRLSVPPAIVAVQAAPTTTATSAVAPATSVAQASPPPDDSAPSLVPVIPASAPPAGDPLVQAVQNDIKEDQQEHGK